MNIQIQPRLNHNKEKWLQLVKDHNYSFEIDETAFPIDEKRKKELIDYYKETGMVTSVHGAFIDNNPVSGDPDIARISQEKCKESCRIAQELGAKNIVFHCSCFPFLRGLYLDEWVKKAADFYCNLAREFKLNIFIENSFDIDPEPLYRLMKQCEVPYVRVCLDFGHANYSREPFETWIDLLGDYIGYVHLSDNMGLFDDHLTIGTGITPWNIVNEMLLNLNPNINVTLETGDYSCTCNSINYLNDNGWILKYNKPVIQEFAPDYFDTASSSNMREYALTASEKDAIELKMSRNREGKFEKRNETMRIIFSKYLSNEIVHRAIEHPDSLELGGKKKNVTMLMSDLHGFTQMSEGMEAEQLITLLNNYFGVMMEIIHRYHGTIIDIIGDGMLVAFGLFDGTDYHADKAVGAAIEMQCYMEDVNKWNKQHGYPSLHMGIGINTGNVVVGNIGSERHIKYGVVGRNVNLCSRIESYTYNGQILISNSTRNACVSPLDIYSEETVYPKGSNKPVTLYHVTKIGGSFNKEFIPKKLDYKKLSKEQEVDFSFVYSKHRAIVMKKGYIIAIAETGAIFKTSENIESRDNIVIDIGEALFCKVRERVENSENIWELSFTAIPPEFEDWMYNLTH